MTTSSAKPGRKRKPLPFVRFDTPTDLPPMAAAATLCVGVLKWTRVNSLEEFQTLAADSASANETFWKQLALLDLDQSQQDLLRSYDPVLKLIRIKPAVTVAVCPACCTREVHGTDGSVAFHGWQVIVGQAPSKCRVTTGCDGKPVKARTPVQVKIERDEDGDAIEPGSETKTADPFDDEALFDFDQPAATEPGPHAEITRATENAVHDSVQSAVTAAVAQSVAQTVEESDHQVEPGGFEDSFADDFDLIDTDFDPGDLSDFDFD